MSIKASGSSTESDMSPEKKVTIASFFLRVMKNRIFCALFLLRVFYCALFSLFSRSFLMRTRSFFFVLHKRPIHSFRCDFLHSPFCFVVLFSLGGRPATERQGNCESLTKPKTVFLNTTFVLGDGFFGATVVPPVRILLSVG